MGELVSESIGLLVIVAIFAALAYLPISIAKRRGHENYPAIKTCALLAILLWPLWFVAMIWAYTGPDRSKLAGAGPRGFPVQTDGPGMYRVIGVDRQTQADAVRTVEAASRENARVKAELAGLVVTEIQFIPRQARVAPPAAGVQRMNFPE